MYCAASECRYMSAMAQIATTAVQAAPLYTSSLMAIMIAFECLDVLQVVGVHDMTSGKLWVGLCAHKIGIYMSMKRYFSAT